MWTSQGVTLTGRVDVFTRPIPANTLRALAVTGVFDFLKETGSSTAISNVYLDVADGEATTELRPAPTSYSAKLPWPLWMLIPPCESAQLMNGGVCPVNILE